MNYDVNDFNDGLLWERVVALMSVAQGRVVPGFGSVIPGFAYVIPADAGI